jgi:hypothetical protein
VIGRVRPTCADGHSEEAVGGEMADGNSFENTTGDFFSKADLFVDWLLLERLLSFSPFPVMTNSGWLCSSLLCLRLMKNQKTPKDASSTTATGTTIAGMRVDRFEEDCFAAALLVAAAEVVEDVRTVEEEEAASADVREA